MTKSEERGENEFTRSAKQQAKRTGDGVCSILARWLSEARKLGDAESIQRIRKAQKSAAEISAGGGESDELVLCAHCDVRRT
jgi:hypothetical protein